MHCPQSEHLSVLFLVSSMKSLVLVYFPTLFGKFSLLPLLQYFGNGLNSASLFMGVTAQLATFSSSSLHSFGSRTELKLFRCCQWQIFPGEKKPKRNEKESNNTKTVKRECQNCLDCFGQQNFHLYKIHSFHCNVTTGMVIPQAYSWNVDKLVGNHKQ